MSAGTTRRRTIECPHCGPGKGRVFEDEPKKRGHDGKLWCFNCRRDLPQSVRETKDERS